MAKGKKTGGRTRGTPNKATAEVREVCVGILAGKDYQQSIVARVKAGTLPSAVECLMWHYAYGKPRETLMVEGEMRPLVIDRVSTRKEMLEALGEDDPDAGEDD